MFIIIVYILINGFKVGLSIGIDYHVEQVVYVMHNSFPRRGLDAFYVLGTTITCIIGIIMYLHIGKIIKLIMAIKLVAIKLYIEKIML